MHVKRERQECTLLLTGALPQGTQRAKKVNNAHSLCVCVCEHVCQPLSSFLSGANKGNLSPFTCGLTKAWLTRPVRVTTLGRIYFFNANTGQRLAGLLVGLLSGVVCWKSTRVLREPTNILLILTVFCRKYSWGKRWMTVSLFEDASICLGPPSVWDVF